MPLVQGKCENCGGILSVDSNLKAANCPFCGVAYIVQDSINNYNTTIHNVESLHADVVNVLDESSSEARVKAGFAFIKIGKYDLAEKEFSYVTRVAPQNHLGWLGLIESQTNNYTKRIRSARELRKLRDYSKSVLAFAPLGQGEGLLKKFTYYIEAEEEQNDKEKSQLTDELTKMENEINSLNKENDSTQLEISKCENSIVNLNKQDGRGSAVLLFFIGLPFLIGGLIIIYTVNTTDFEWTDEALVGTIFLVSPCLLSSVFGIYNSIRAKKITSEINVMKSKQEELQKELQANKDKETTIKDRLKFFQDKTILYE